MGVRTGTFPGEVMVLTIFLLFSLASLAHCWGDKASAGSEWNKDYDEPAFTSEARPGYEARTYAPSTWACTNMTVDTAADPLAGLDDQDFTKLMQSKRYKKKVPSSKMFWRLFRYIGGMNEGNVGRGRAAGDVLLPGEQVPGHPGRCRGRASPLQPHRIHQEQGGDEGLRQEVWRVGLHCSHLDEGEGPVR